MRTILISSIAVLLASCTPMVDTRGHSGEDVDVSQLIMGQSKREDVQALLGSPTSTSTFGDEIWYYITQQQTRVAIFAPEVSEQRVTAITFDANQVISTISAFKKEDGKEVQIVSKTTPTEGHSVTVIEQMLGNFGRFNAPARGLSDRNRGR